MTYVKVDIDRSQWKTRNYTYTLPQLVGQVPSDSYDKRLSMNGTFNNRASSKFFGFPILGPTELPFNFTDGTSTSGGALISFIRLNAGGPGLGDVLAADICALSFCAQKRNVSVTLNRLSSSILQTVYGKKITVNLELEDYHDFDILSFIEDDFNITFPSLPIRLYGDSLANDRDNHVSSALFEWELRLQELVSYFQGEMTENGLNDDVGAFGIMNAFNASLNISMTMENIAIGLTNFVRDSSNLTVSGQVGQVQVFVHVTWPWIILPTFLVVAGTIFLMLAMYETKRQGASVWRTSELALLFCGRKLFDDELHALQVSEMEHAASKMRVQMTKTSTREWILYREKED
jgi:hypothetical protein